MDGKIGYTATIGPLFLMLLPLALLGWLRFDADRRRSLIDMLIMIACAHAGWLIGLVSSATLLQTRLSLPSFPLFAIIAAGSLQTVAAYNRSSLCLPRIIGVLGSIVLLATGLKIGLDFSRSDTLSVLTSGQSRADYLTKQLGW